MLEARTAVSADPKKVLPYINIFATTRTENKDPIYSKLYPYPMGASDFENSETNTLLKEGIIRPSRFYIYSVWVVDKKGTDDKDTKQHPFL